MNESFHNMFLVRREQCLPVLLEAFFGNPTYRDLIRACATTLVDGVKRKTKCLFCENLPAPNPAAVCVVMPDVKSKGAGPAITFLVCDDCVSGNDLDDRVISRLRACGVQARAVQEGHA